LFSYFKLLLYASSVVFGLLVIDFFLEVDDALPLLLDTSEDPKFDEPDLVRDDALFGADLPFLLGFVFNTIFSSF
jgi:hypothetical protein